VIRPADYRTGPLSGLEGAFQLAESVDESSTYMYQRLEQACRSSDLGAPLGGPVGDEGVYGGPPLRVAAEAGPRSDTAPLFITIEEAAELVGVDPKTIGRWSREDATFPVLRRGRVVRVHRERYLAWLERQMPRRAARRAQESADAA
jgi:excisionase family DNA binding protein